ncbi:LuxR C-terminal-related transcriptional regulator [Actinomycetospora atypica]|uniref:LuxR C-terminal-related transcriptional regulator n=1 Tax=Actinomycetospora atypica TaxID=1290095 RepID=A0ABV9YN37_9PSEU
MADGLRAVPARPGGTTDGSWPFVGRRDDLTSASRALDDGRGLLLAGPAGVGKTRMARELLRTRAAGGEVVRRALATSATAGIPLGALGPLLPARLGDDPAGPNLVHAAARALVRDLDGRLVLGVDDAHLLDPTSAAVVGQLALTGAATVVLTARADERLPDTVFALWKEGAVVRLDVGNLDRAAVDEVVAEALGGQLDGAALHRMWTLTQGNPLFLRELVTSAREQGHLRRVDGVWVWSGRPGPSAGLAEILDQRLDGLDRVQRDAVELLAFGEPLGLETVERLVDPDALDRLERAALVVSEQFGRRVDLRLAHPLYAELLRGRATPLRQRSVHRRLAAAQESVGARRTRDRMRLITWRLAGALPVDPTELCSAAEQLLHSDPASADRLARAAWDAGGGFAAGLLRGRALLASGRADEGETLLATLVPETDEQRVRLATTRAQNLFYALGSPARAADVVRALDAGPTGDADPRELVVVRAAIANYERDHERALAILGSRLDDLLAGVADPDAGTLQAYVVAAGALRGVGRFETLTVLARQGGDLATALGSAAAEWQTMHLQMALVSAHAHAGDLTTAVGIARGLYDDALAADLAGARIVLGGFAGLVEFLRGRVRSSTAAFRDALAGVRDGAAPLVPILRAGLAQSAALAGELATADDVLASLDDGHEEYRAWVLQARAWTEAVHGRRARAVGTVLVAVDAAFAQRDAALSLVVAQSAVRLGAADAVVDRLGALVAGMEGRLGPAVLAQARALVDGDAGALDALVDGFEAMGSPLLAAEVAAQAADLHRGAGRAGPADAATARARSLARACEGARTPALELLGARDDLTPRELEVARLAARGLTSRAISEQLTLSVRTVDNALRVVYAKLGVAGRRELAEVDLT